jgi:hypothetical protein
MAKAIKSYHVILYVQLTALFVEGVICQQRNKNSLTHPL